MNLKKLVSVLLVLVMVLSMAACKDNGDTQETTATEPAGAPAAHTVTVESAGGMPLSEVEVFVYAADDLSDMKGFAETDAEGKASIELPKGGDYAIVLSGVPEGYDVKESYSFNGAAADIELTSSLVKDKDLSGASLGLGDVMYDFTVTSTDGETITLSEVLEEKEMVLLNFFFTTCGPCANEFPYMNEAYQMYQDKAAVIALDPLDDNATVAAYKASMGLSFPMAACNASWSQTFGITGYPTTLIVDRYGVICLVEVGGLTSLTPFTSMFEHFTAEDYEQKLCVNGVADVVTRMKPTETMPSSEEIAAVISNGDIPVTYMNAGESDLEYNWPFIIGEKNGDPCIMTTNQEIEGSYSILRMEVELKAGQALGFDYIISSEAGVDILYVIVNDEPVNNIAGYDEVPVWKSLYPCVAETDGTYEISLCYMKDDSTNAGEDTAYIKNVRIVNESDIDTDTYLARQAATTEDGFTYNYVDIVLNEEDGYYHVGEKNGPLLLANLMNTSEFNEEDYIWGLVYAGGLTVDGVDYAPTLEKYANYASNSNLTGYCTVNEKLVELLKAVDTLYGFDDADENEWLRACIYYKSYGPGNTQLEDPIAGLAPFSAYKATLGKNVASNYFYYNRIIMPRGLLAEFIPTQSGVYRITSVSESANGVDAWIFDENHKELMVYEMDERLYTDDSEVSMVFYMEAGKPYYIDIAFWDPYEVGQINYDIEYMGSSVDFFRRCSQSYFTYDSNATGDAMYYLIHGGIDVVLGDDGIYYQDLGDGQKGGKIYCDFTGVTTLFSQPVASSQAYDEDGNKLYDDNGEPVMIDGMIDMGGFDFSKTEDDLYVLSFLEAQGGDPEKTKEYLKGLWGAEYDAYAETYLVDDVLEGKYHGSGPDLTEEIRTYLDKVITSGPAGLRGCVVVDERLGEILQMLMDKYTFANVDQSWVKMCYYYDYIGPNDTNVVTNLTNGV